MVAGPEGLEIGKRISEHTAQDLGVWEVLVGKAAGAPVLDGLGVAEERLIRKAFAQGTSMRECWAARSMIYECGIMEPLQNLAAHVAKRLSLTSRFAHLNAASFSFHGEYESEEGRVGGGYLHLARVCTLALVWI